MTQPPEPLDAAILFAPVGALVPAALAALRKGGRVVCGGIHMSDIPAFPYSLLWEERSVASVANLTRADGHEFLALAPQAKVRTTTTPYPLDRANEALDDLRTGRARRRGGARAVRRRLATKDCHACKLHFRLPRSTKLWACGTPSRSAIAIPKSMRECL